MKRHLLLLGAGLLATAAPTYAINITLVDITPAGDYPNFDPTGANVLPLLQAAASRWEDIIEDGVNVTINWRYREITGLASATVLNFNGAGQPIECRINIDNSEGVRTWYFDPTPTNHSEYDLVQRIYRDLTTTQQDNWFGPFVADKPTTLLESSYRGTTNGTAPANAVSGFDMYSTVIHEMGHCLGLSSANSATEADAVTSGDFDFDIPGTWTNGDVFDVATDGTDPNTNNQWAHIAAQSLMCNGCAATGLRRLPAAIDILTVAHLGQWTNIDLPRQDFLPGGTTNWNTAGNWEGNQVPGAADDAYLRLGTEVGGGAGYDVSMSAGDAVRSLFLSSATDLFTQENRLDVSQTATIEFDGNFPFPQIFVGVGGELEAQDLVINGGELDVAGGLVDIQDDLILEEDTMGRQGVITGAGTVDVAGTLNNEGRITATSEDGPTLTFTSAAASPWDLDGAASGDGEVYATGGNINFASGAVSDAFNGTMRVDDPHTLTIAEPWSLATGGLIDLNGGDPDFATFAGGLVTASNGELQASGLCRVSAPVTLSGSAQVNVLATAGNDRLELDGANTISGGTFTISSDSQLWIDGSSSVSGGSFSIASGAILDSNGSVTYSGGSYTGAGEFNLDGTATFSGNTVVDCTRFDFDGNGVGQTHTLSADLIINSTELDDFGASMNDNLTFTNSSAEVVVNNVSSWTMAAILTYNTGTITTSSSITGAPFTLSGTANVNGSTRWDAISTITGTVNVVAGHRLSLNANLPDLNRINGGTVNGPGALRSTSSSALAGNGSISADIDFLPTCELWADNGTLTLSGSFISTPSRIGTLDADGTLDVTPSWTVPAGTTLEMNGGVVTGGFLTNENVIEGTGTITSSNVRNNGEISATNNGTLTIDTAVGADLDGTGTTSEHTLNAVDGNLTVVDTPGDALGCILNIGPNRTMMFTSGWTMDFGDLNMTGGTNSTTRARLDGPGTFTATGGTIDCTEFCEINAPVDFSGGLVFSLLGTDVNVNGPIIISGGTYNVPAGSTLHLNGDGIISGGTFNVEGFLDINGDIDISDGTFNIAAGGRLDLDGTHRITGGMFLGDGQLRFDGSPIIDSSVMIDVATLDLDGTLNSSVVEVNANLGLNSGMLDLANSVFNGTLNINGGTTKVTVNGPGSWEMAGIMNVATGNNLTFQSIEGMPFTMSGVTNIADATRWDAVATISGTVNIDNAAGALALLGGDPVTTNLMAGGTINGPGKLRATSDTYLVGFGDINAPVEFLGPENGAGNDTGLLADDGILRLGGPFLNVPTTIGTADGDGVLDVVNSWTLTANDTLILNGGTVTGGDLNSASTTIGSGNLTMSGLVNSGTITAIGGGTIRIDTAGGIGPDLDGVNTSTSVLNALDGNIVVVDAVSNPYDDEANIGMGRTMNFQGGWTLAATGILTMTGGGVPDRATLGGDTVVLGTIEADGEIALAGFMDYRNGATVNLAGAGTSLRHFGDAQIAAGAAFNGPGTILQVAGGTMRLLDGVNLGPDLSSAGALEFGAGTGSALVKVTSLSLTHLADAVFDLNGDPASNNYDRLQVVTNAGLGGDLRVRFNAPGAVVGDTWKIIDAGSYTGGFAGLTVSGLPADKTLFKFETPTGVYLKLAGAGTYEDWALGEGIPLSDIDFGDNPDGDYFENVFELFLDGDPLVAEPASGLVPLTINVGGTDYLAIVLRFSNKFAASDVGLEVTRSTDLVTFSTNNVVLHTSAYNPGTCIETRVYRSTVPYGSIPQEYLRLEAVPIP